MARVVWSNNLRRLSADSRALMTVTLIGSTALFALNPFIAVHLPEYAPGAGPIGVTLASSAMVGGVAALLLSAIGGGTHNGRALIARWSIAGLAAGATTLAFLPSVPPGLRPFTVMVGMVLLRGCQNLYSNASRSLHLLTNGPNIDAGVLFATVGTFFGIGSAMGPVLGGILLAVGGLGTVLATAATMFLVCLIPLLWGIRRFVGSSIDTSPVVAVVPGLVQRLRPSSGRAARICLGMGAAYILDAQSIAYIPLTIEHHYPLGDRLTVAFFTTNAVLLVVGSVPVMRAMQQKIPQVEWQVGIGVTALLTSLVLLRCAASALAALLASAVLYTLGEIVVMAIGMVLIRAEMERDETAMARNVAFLNFTTTTLGTGAGQYVGTAVAALRSPLWHAVVWTVVAVVSVAVLWQPRASVMTAERTDFRGMKGAR